MKGELCSRYRPASCCFRDAMPRRYAASGSLCCELCSLQTTLLRPFLRFSLSFLLWQQMQHSLMQFSPYITLYPRQQVLLSLTATAMTAECALCALGTKAQTRSTQIQSCESGVTHSDSTQPDPECYPQKSLTATSCPRPMRLAQREPPHTDRQPHLG
jgi:hypothetical protein